MYFAKEINRVEEKELISAVCLSYRIPSVQIDPFTKTRKLLHHLPSHHGVKGETRVCGMPGPASSGDGVRYRSHGDASEHHNNSRAAARLLCQRVASQAGKTGARKFSVLENGKEKQSSCC